MPSLTSESEHLPDRSGSPRRIAAEASSLVVDTSAAVAVILGEPGSEELAAHLEDALVRLRPAAIRVELGIVIEARLWPAGHDVVERFLRDAKVDVVPVGLADRAMSGWRRYGKGRHPAGLNFGACFTYALADRPGHPVLCTGDDFAATDIMVVRPGTEPTGVALAPIAPIGELTARRPPPARTSPTRRGSTAIPGVGRPHRHSYTYKQSRSDSMYS